MMKRNTATTNQSKPLQIRNNSPLQEIPEDLLVTISGGVFIDDEEDPLFVMVAGTAFRG